MNDINNILIAISKIEDLQTEIENALDNIANETTSRFNAERGTANADALRNELVKLDDLQELLNSLDFDNFRFELKRALEVA